MGGTGVFKVRVSYIWVEEKVIWVGVAENGWGRGEMGREWL